MSLNAQYQTFGGKRWENRCHSPSPNCVHCLFGYKYIDIYIYKFTSGEEKCISSYFWHMAETPCSSKTDNHMRNQEFQESKNVIINYKYLNLPL